MCPLSSYSQYSGMFGGPGTFWVLSKSSDTLAAVRHECAGQPPKKVIRGRHPEGTSGCCPRTPLSQSKVLLKRSKSRAALHTSVKQTESAGACNPCSWIRSARAAMLAVRAAKRPPRQRLLEDQRQVQIALADGHRRLLAVGQRAGR